MKKISGNFPRIISGHSIEVGGERYDSVKKLAEGGFAKVYVGKYQGQLEALKVYKREFFLVVRERESLSASCWTYICLCLQVQSPALEWELAVIEELHTRLNSKGLQMWTVSSLLKI